MALRNLTRESILGLGKHRDLSVQQVLDKKEGSYLVWVYYNISHITFSEDILNEIGVNKSMRIEKPSKKVKQGRKVIPQNFSLEAAKMSEKIDYFENYRMFQSED